MNSVKNVNFGSNEKNARKIPKYRGQVFFFCKKHCDFLVVAFCHETHVHHVLFIVRGKKSNQRSVAKGNYSSVVNVFDRLFVIFNSRGTFLEIN